jgi:hypothetical protein
MSENYKIVLWPDSQQLMTHERFYDCLLIDDIPGHVSLGSAAYAVPESLYNEIFG